MCKCGNSKLSRTDDYDEAIARLLSEGLRQLDFEADAIMNSIREELTVVSSVMQKDETKSLTVHDCDDDIGRIFGMELQLFDSEADAIMNSIREEYTVFSSVMRKDETKLLLVHDCDDDIGRIIGEELQLLDFEADAIMNSIREEDSADFLSVEHFNAGRNNEDDYARETFYYDDEMEDEISKLDLVAADLHIEIDEASIESIAATFIDDKEESHSDDKEGEESKGEDNWVFKSLVFQQNKKIQIVNNDEEKKVYIYDVGAQSIFSLMIFTAAIWGTVFLWEVNRWKQMGSMLLPIVMRNMMGLIRGGQNFHSHRFFG